MNLKNKLLITGYNGYIGKYLINFLKKKKIKYKKLDIEKCDIANFYTTN